MGSFLNVVLSMELAVANTTLSTAPINDVPAPNTLAATTVYYNPAVQIATYPGTVIPIPPNPDNNAIVVYVKNLDPTNELAITYEFNSSLGQTVTLVPGGVFMLFNPIQGDNGINFLYGLASMATINAEVFLAY